MFKGINHVGIVVQSIDDTLGFLSETFGAEEVSRVELPQLQQVSSIVRIGNGQFELMEPMGPDGVVGKFLEGKGGGLHHISLLCDDLDAACQEMEAKGFKVLGRMPDGPRVAFLHPKASKGILFELAEKR
ncbi:MAG: VOC family protein [Proteobacteria bacterium]|nr:VOC family protein [Pseudomonadota bacterium]